MNLGEDERQLQAERMMIEEIKKRPFLWDETLPEHKDMEKARAAWENVGRIFGMSGAKAKSRWKSMRDIYVRYLRKLALKGGTVPKWKHFEAMNFITDHIKHRRGDLQYNNFAAGIAAPNNAIDGEKPGQGIKYDVMHNSDDDEEAGGAGTSKRVTRGRKRKRMAAAAANTSTPVTAPPPAATTAVLRGASRSTPGTNTNTVGSMMPVLQAVIPPDGQPITAGTVLHHQQQPPPPGLQHMTMIGTGLVPVTSISCVPSTSSGLNGGRNLTGQETTSFTAVSFDDDADDLFGRAVAATLKKMPPRMKALSKLRIQQVLYELEEAAGNTPPPNAVIYQANLGAPSIQPQQAPPPQAFM